METQAIILTILGAIGLLLSIYAYYIEYESRKHKHYHAVCDLNDQVSCTKAFSSKYGHIMGVSNSLFGVLFYILIIVLVILSLPNIILYLSIISLIGSIYLAYASYFKLKNFCLICNAIYLINILLVVFSYLWR